VPSRGTVALVSSPGRAFGQRNYHHHVSLADDHLLDMGWYWECLAGVKEANRDEYIRD